MTATQAQHKAVSGGGLLQPRGRCVMTGRCCSAQGVRRRLARRVSKAAASILPGAVLILLPKCPLCLAAWLTVMTGVGFSAASAAWMRGMLVVFCVTAVALAAAPIVRRSAVGHPRTPLHRLNIWPAIVRTFAIATRPSSSPNDSRLTQRSIASIKSDARGWASNG